MLSLLQGRFERFSGQAAHEKPYPVGV